MFVKKEWFFLVCLLFLGNWINVMLVSLESIENNYFMILLPEHVENFNRFIMICVALCVFLLQMETNISWILLMITLGCVGCTCWKINHKILKILKNFMYGFKMKPSLVLALFALIMEENIHLMDLKTIFVDMGSSIKP